jgi:hypothetical protein
VHYFTSGLHSQAIGSPSDQSQTQAGSGPDCPRPNFLEAYTLAEFCGETTEELAAWKMEIKY